MRNFLGWFGRKGDGAESDGAWESSDGAREDCVSKVGGGGATIAGLGSGNTNCGRMAFHGGTDGELSSEVAADVDVRAGVATFCKRKQVRHRE